MALTLGRQGAVQQQGAPPGGVLPSTLHKLKLLQTWQPFNFEQTVRTCLTYGFTGLLVKALDGVAWMGRSYDGSPDALSSLEQIQQQVRWAHDEGLYYFCWTNPLSSVEMPLQATLSGQVANVCDGLFLDVEPYDQFWGADRAVGLATQTMKWIRREAPEAFIALQPDPRPVRLGEIKVWEWLAYCDALAGQHYWSDFVKPRTATWRDALDELESAARMSMLYNVPNLVTVQGNAPPLSYPIEDLSTFPGLVVYRMGTTPSETLGMLARVEVRGIHSSRISRLA